MSDSVHKENSGIDYHANYDCDRIGDPLILCYLCLVSDCNPYITRNIVCILAISSHFYELLNFMRQTILHHGILT